MITAQGVWGNREERSRNLPERKRISLSATWMDLKMTVFSEINQAKTNIASFHLYVEYKKKTSEQT